MYIDDNEAIITLTWDDLAEDLQEEIKSRMSSQEVIVRVDLYP